MKKTQFKNTALCLLIVLAFANSALAMNSDPYPLMASTPTSPANRVIESGLVHHVGMIVFVTDSSPKGVKFEEAYFGDGSKNVFDATDGMYVQIMTPQEIPGGAVVGSILALTPDGGTILSTLKGAPSLRELRQFSNASRRLLMNQKSDHSPTAF